MSRKRTKPTATQKTINSINRYIRTIAETFGTDSKEYERAVTPLHNKDITLSNGRKGFEIYENKKGVVQLRNNKLNRQKHQQIKKIKKQQKPVNIIKRKYPKTFDKWMAKTRSNFADLIEEIYGYRSGNSYYNGLVDALGAMGVDVSSDMIHNMFKDSAYRESQWQRVFDAGATRFMTLDEFVDSLADDISVDRDTGEQMNYGNNDFEGYSVDSEDSSVDIEFD